MSPPPLDHRLPPMLIDDAMREIFLRVPPDDPATLARASAVCTAWRGIISDADFGREYRRFHGAPPVLGFLYNCPFPYTSSHFVSTAASSRSPACHDRHQDWCALDSRHGLVLFNSDHDSLKMGDLAVSDLVTHEWVDHLDCSDDGAFLVALVGYNESAIFASVYSSEAGEWSDTISIERRNAYYVAIDGMGHSAVVGDKVYVPCGWTNMIVEYDMGAQELAVTRALFSKNFVGAEDGMLLFATVEDTLPYVWSVQPGTDGAAPCRRVIDLGPLLPHLAFCSVVAVVGYAEGAGAIFLRTAEEEAVFIVELSSCRTKRIHLYIYSDKVVPYMSFYTGGHGERGRRALVGATRRLTGLLWLYVENLP